MSWAVEMAGVMHNVADRARRAVVLVRWDGFIFLFLVWVV